MSNDNGRYTPCLCSEINDPKSSYAPEFRSFEAEEFGGDHESYLQSRGYHKTSDRLGGGWAKPKTYRPDLWNWNSFRDHAYFHASYSVLRAQELELLDGEPNPEIDEYEWT